MINSIGQSVSSAVEASKLRAAGKSGATASTASVDAGDATETVSSPAARMAAEGAPVDLDRIAAIKAAIASGNYPVDPQRIADRMVDLDLPVRD
ncbi:MAG: flagellar biosynthesis anti-sigma factor FlgM [Sphingobium sp.]|jgi:negative regulator of flagellin synthesis FlgM|nr:MAG: flagellar biosynthesis anti-sigma factor FlgM [Sphingobium sp.]